MKLPPDIEARILAMPGTRVNGQAVTSEVCAPAPPAFTSEAEFQSWIVAYAKDRGWMTYHTHDSRRSTAGFPDLVMVRMTGSARLIVAELKMPGNKPTEAQRTWLRAFERSGAEVFTWWPEHVPEIREVLA